VCKLIEDCPGAYEDLLADKTPVGCGYLGFDPIICCVSTENRMKPIEKPIEKPKPPEHPPKPIGRGRVARASK